MTIVNTTHTSICILDHANGATGVDDQDFALLDQGTNGLSSSDGIVLAEDLGLEGRVDGSLGIHLADDGVQAESSVRVLVAEGERIIAGPGDAIQQLGVRVARLIG